MESFKYGFRKQKVISALLFIALLSIPTNSSSNVCVLRGRITTTLEWYGYLLQKTFQQNISRIQYTIYYPLSECCAFMLIYYDDQIRNLSQDMSCVQREQVLNKESKQLIPLSNRNGTVGCQEWREDGKEAMILCVGERTLKSSAPRTWYIVISKCGSSEPITLNYMFNISGFYGKCEEDPLSKTVIQPKQVEEDKTTLNVAIAMGVLAGVAIVAVIVFTTLFIISRRQMKQKPKTSNGSVTSSQATMTPDIFYVNPSLSDREHSDSQYSRSSSENYYEVIPDRRSYESINTQLALHGHGSRALNLASFSREARSRIPSYIFEDIPPPPYQPSAPHGQVNHGSSAGHNAQSSGPFLSHQLMQASSPYSSSGLQHIQMAARSMPTSTHTESFIGPVTMATTTRMPLQSNNNGLTTSANTLQVPNHSSMGNCSSSSGVSPSSQHIQSGGITTSAGGLNSHGTNTITRQMCEDEIPLQTCGPLLNELNGSIGRYPSHNINHVKLLSHNYQVQRFETTA